MSKITFHKISAKNFHSFDDFELVITPGRHLIVGENRSSGSANSNGSGKSSLMETIPWTIFKKTTRGRDPSKNYKGNCETVLEFSKDGSHYKAMRYWKDKEHKNDLKLFKDGEDLSLRKKTNTEEELEKLIGIPYDLFISIIVIIQGLPINFTSLTPTVRKGLVEDMFNVLAIWERYGKKFSGVYQEKELERAQKEQEFQTAREKMTELNAQLETWKKTQAQAKEDLTKQAKEFENTLVSLGDELGKAETECNNCGEKASQAGDSEALFYSLETAKTRLNTLQQIINQKLCPTCGQDYPRSQIKEAEQEAGFLQEKMPKLDASYQQCKVAQAAFREANEKFRELQQRRRMLKEQLAIVFQRMQHQNEVVDLDKLQEDLNGSVSTVNGLNAELAETNKVIEHVNYFSGLMMPSSQFRTNVLEKYIGYLNSILDSVVPLLFEGAELKLVVSSKGAGIDLDLKIKGKEIEFKSLSGGERKRLDIAIILAFVRFEIESSGISTNLVVLDEIFDSLDVRGIENVVAVLDSLFPESTAVYIITHNDSLKSTFNSLVKVVKESDNSVLELT
jgi:DNA repair exonuclease SbcCD ATPase subunit